MPIRKCKMWNCKKFTFAEYCSAKCYFVHAGVLAKRKKKEAAIPLSEKETILISRKVGMEDRRIRVNSPI